ncbi:MAG: hypothetical protein AB1704_42350 [Pseudomonadota bacterium]
MSSALTGEARDATAPAADEATCKWRPSGEFAMVHPSGWSIARYSVYGDWRYLLWEPIDRCTAASNNAFHGPFENVRGAMRLHRDLSAHLPHQEMAA